MLVVGLTGDVGAGKSTVGQFWKGMGATVIDADAIAKKLWAEPDILRQTTGRWGMDIVDIAGNLVPSRVSSIVFENHEEYRWLCDLLHPRVRARIENSVENSGGWIVVEIPLLFEGGVPWWMDLTVYVAAPREVRVSRNTHRNWDLSEIVRRESWLLPRDDKIHQAHLVIRNTGTLEELREELTRLAQNMKSLSSITEILFRFNDTENARAFASLLSTHGLATDLSLSTSQDLETGDRKVSLDGFCFNQKLPEIHKLLEQQKMPDGTIRTQPIRHMDLTSLQRLSGKLSS